MRLLIIIITIFLEINLYYAFYDQFVLDRFGKRQFELGQSNINIDKRCNSTEKICIWKCCPAGQIMMRFKLCLPSNITFTNVTIYNEEFVPINGTLENIFKIVPALMSEEIFASNSLWWYTAHLIEDGRLFLNFPNVYNRWKEIRTNHFCIEMKQDGNELRPVFMAEYEMEPFSKPNTYKKCALIVSVICVILTFIAYVLIPHLRNQNGVIFMIYLGCLIIALITQCILENYTSMNFRLSGILTVVLFHYFFKICSFCWTNVIFYLLLRNESKLVSSKKDLLKYCAYAFVLPLCLTIMLAIIELNDMSDTPSFVTPQILRKGNFRFNEMESLYYVYMPILLLLGINWCISYIKFVQFCKSSIKKAAAVVSVEQERNTREIALNKPMHFMKLLAVLTVFTLIDMLTVIYPEGTNDIASTFNMFFGFIILIIFIHGQKVARCCCMGPD